MIQAPGCFSSASSLPPALAPVICLGEVILWSFLKSGDGDIHSSVKFSFFSVHFKQLPYFMEYSAHFFT
jgi:hypothetical protein